MTGFGAPKILPVSKPTIPIVQPPVVTPTKSDDFPWMIWMRSHIGESEMTGEKATAFEKLCFSFTDYGSITVEPSGCAATACAALELSGYKSPHSASAISFKRYGEMCALKPGCVVVFEWPSGDHHVTFCDKLNSDGTFDALGGNQGHLLKVATYGKGSIIACRWPVKI